MQAGRAGFRWLTGPWRKFLARQKRTTQVARQKRRLHHIYAGLAAGRPLVCIGLIEHFGDILACEPVARATRERYPDAYLCWITRPAYRDLVAYHPALDEVITIDSFTGYCDLLAKTVVDDFIDLHVNDRPCAETGRLHQKRSGDPSVTAANYYDHGTLLEAFCRSAGIPTPEASPKLFLPPEVDSTITGLVPNSPFLVLHASSTETSRDWQVDHWRNFASWLTAHLTVEVVEVGLRPLIAGQVPGVRNLCGQLSLPQLGALIRRAAGFVGVDSGPAHFANAAARPSVILLGSYRRFPRYMPYTGFLRQHEHEMIIIHDGPAANIPIAAVIARVQKIWPHFIRPPAGVAAV